MQGLDTDAMHGLLKQKEGTVTSALGTVVVVVVVIVVVVVMFAADPIEGGRGQGPMPSYSKRITAQ